MARIALIAKLALCLFVLFSVVGWFGGLIAEFHFEAGERTSRYWIGFACAIVILGVPYFLAMYISSQGLRRLKSLREKIRRPLLARLDCNEESFYHQFPNIDRELLAGIRVAIAKTEQDLAKGQSAERLWIRTTGTIYWNLSSRFAVISTESCTSRVAVSLG